MFAFFRPDVVSISRQAPLFSRCLAGGLILLLSFSANAAPAKPPEKRLKSQTVAPQTQTKEARERMRNRKKLLDKAKSQRAVVPLTPQQKSKEAARKLALRAQNREQLAMHTRWKPGRFGGSESLLPLSTEALMAGMNSPRIEATLHKVIHRLKQQLGKPYVWGGQTPNQGFDCSGLVYFAYNKLLNRTLPRTANGMFQDRSLKHVPQEALRRGDLIFFRITSREGADHVGVYLGDGQFIEAPRTGLNIRISQFGDDYWQDRYLGAKRILTEDSIL